MESPPPSNSNTEDELSCHGENGSNPSHAENNTERPTTAFLGGAAPAKASDAYVISFDNNKAGLEKVDKSKTEALIQELSEGSYFYQNEQRKAAARERKIAQMLEKKRRFEAEMASAAHRGRYTALVAKVEAMEAEMIREADVADVKSGRVWVHLDMDMFYAGCEEKKRPELRTKPLGVGSTQMLSTTNYIARQYGVRAGMPGFIGKRLCPELLIVPTDFPYYKEQSLQVRAVVQQYDPHFTALGWDELTMEVSAYIHAERQRAWESDDATGGDAALDTNDGPPVTDANSADVTTADRRGVWRRLRPRLTMDQLYDAAEEVMAEVRGKIKEVTQLTASAGIAPTPTLAKIASNYNKPDGQHSLRLFTRKDIMAFMHAMPCRKVPGIGKAQDHILSGLGVHSVGDIYKHRVLLHHLITPKTYQFLLSTSLGVGGFFGVEGDGASGSREGSADAADAAAGTSGWDRKSIGQECTFYNLKSAVELETIARQNMLDAHAKMKEEGRLTGQIALKLKHVNFHVKQYSHRIDPPTDSEEVIQRALNSLMSPIAFAFRDYRLLGVRLEKLITQAQFDQQRQQQQDHLQPTLLDLIANRKRPRDSPRSSRSPPSSCFSISDGDDSSNEEEEGNDDDEEESDVVIVDAPLEERSIASTGGHPCHTSSGDANEGRVIGQPVIEGTVGSASSCEETETPTSAVEVITKDRSNSDSVIIIE